MKGLPIHAFDLITDSMGFRAVAVALYRVITSKNVVLIVETAQQTKNLEMLVGTVTKSLPAGFLGLILKEDLPFIVTNVEEFKRNWTDFVGKEICMVEKETTVKNPGVDLMEQTLGDTLSFEVALGSKSPSDNSIRQIIQILRRITAAVKQSRINYAGELPSEENFSKQSLRTETERLLVKHISIMLGK
ncbi:MAG: hypothetical protein GWN31_16855 [Candidatus Thorarchaeota archaeon]|nr:hypothetical protein [Candidatus Thorarchaeota archaeon]NIW15554.1 hypothetical protein [Candidatus Thorarchaeota archaeon]NIW53495.1 hypothetical protein [Candidatus Korarchaeota archaeon]